MLESLIYFLNGMHKNMTFSVLRVYNRDNQWRCGREAIIFLSENFLRKSIDMKGMFTLNLKKTGWTEQSS